MHLSNVVGPNVQLPGIPVHICVHMVTTQDLLAFSSDTRGYKVASCKWLAAKREGLGGYLAAIFHVPITLRWCAFRVPDLGLRDVSHGKGAADMKEDHSETSSVVGCVRFEADAGERIRRVSFFVRAMGSFIHVQELQINSTVPNAELKWVFLIS